jgi:uncharacterized damage-inducible protein DinB
MNYYEQVIRATQWAVDYLFHSARAVPADKLEWKPLDAGRSVLNLAQECAQSPKWFAALLLQRSFTGVTPELLKAMEAERSAWKTLDECERVCRENSEIFYSVIRSIPETDLEIRVPLPFAGGMEPTLAEIMMFHYWHCTYHLGQVNYIQTLYGDLENH